jgi:hypothetical protein
MKLYVKTEWVCPRTKDDAVACVWEGRDGVPGPTCEHTYQDKPCGCLEKRHYVELPEHRHTVHSEGGTCGAEWESSPPDAPPKEGK